MANTYTRVTPAHPLGCTKEEFMELQSCLDDDLRTASDRGVGEHGLVLDWDETCKDIVLHHGESGYLWSLSDKTLECLGRIIANNSLHYWKFGVAHTCDRPRCAEFGGFNCRIYADGRLERAGEYWDEGLSHFIVVGSRPDCPSVTWVEELAARDLHGALDQFVRLVNPNCSLPEEVVDDDDFVLRDDTGMEWARIDRVFEIAGPTLELHV